jgi:hypothetical protein
MAQILRPGQVVNARIWNKPCVVREYIGGGGQGEVYRCEVDGQPFALKWYLSTYLPHAPRLRERLEYAVKDGPPSDRFLWPLDLTVADNVPGFGYLMKLREKRFRGLVAWLKRDVNPRFYALATTGLELADGMLLLHVQKGLCYRDISYSNVFFDPETGEVRICDNDNVDVNGQPGEIEGTPSFMAPEIVCGTALPSIETDRHSLAVLLFLLFVVHHPLEGKKEWEIHSLDAPARRKLYGLEPVFLFDPANDSNRPVPGYHHNPLAYWPIYPQFLRDLFTRAFTDGLRDPKNGRVRESEWRMAMVQLRDAIFHCGRCQAENFYDAESPRPEEPTCWHCKRPCRLPARLEVGKSVVMLNPWTKLFPHHLDPLRLYDFSAPCAEVTAHPTQPDVLGLKNLSAQPWNYQGPDRGPAREVAPGRNCRIAAGASIQFGRVAGEIR